MNTQRKPELDISARKKEDFFKRGRAIAKKLDKNEPLEGPSKNIWFEDPDDLMQFLSKNKFDLIDVLRRSPHTMAELVHILKRNRSAIEKDLKVLSMFGLVECELKANPGHGRVKVARATNNEPVTLQIRF